MSIMPGPYIAVCGHCRMPMEAHPVEQCDLQYIPVNWNGRVVGYRMIEKEKQNGEAKEKKVST